MDCFGQCCVGFHNWLTKNKLSSKNKKLTTFNILDNIS